MRINRYACGNVGILNKASSLLLKSEFSSSEQAISPNKRTTVKKGHKPCYPGQDGGRTEVK